MPIATLQADRTAYIDSFVTIEGQITIRTNFHPFAASSSGWIQDNSGRGIHLFGSGANNVALTNIGNIVRLTGEVQLTSGTLGLTNLTNIQLQTSGNPRKTSVRLPTDQADSAFWDGTYLSVNGLILSSALVSGGRNYNVDDGSGVVVVRVLNGVGGATIPDSTRVTALGVGRSQQMLVGAGNEIFAETPGPDAASPLLVGAWAHDGRDSITVTFNELVNPTSGGTNTNYEVFETATPANVLAVTTATVSGARAVLQLGTLASKGVAYTVRVSNVQDTSGNPMAAPQTIGFRPPVGDTTPPSLVSASTSSSTSVTVTFSEPVSIATAGDAANYEVFVTATPATTVPVSAAAVNGAVATLTLGAALQAGTGYTVRVQDIEDQDGNTMVGAQTATFTTAPNVTPIADIHNNLSAYKLQTVTIQGQIYIPANYIASRFSGYIQDSSGRGINLFGNTANNAALFNTSNIVTVVGVVDTFFTTIEIVNISSVQLVSSGNPQLQPQILSTGAAANPSWEGTFIQASGPITSIGTTGGSAPATNYTINDGTGPVVIRVVDDIGAPTFTVGQTITGRGAGGAFQSDFQIHIGRVADVFTGGGGPDTTPPTLVSAAGPSANQARVTFSERVSAATAAVAGNYQLQPTAGGAAVPITTATLGANGTSVTLALGSAMTNGTNYTITVNNVQDEAGNAIAANSTVAFTYTTFTGTPIADIQANPSAFEGQVVTVRGQVFVPSNYIASRFSGYIQDESGRGINLFGNGANNAALFDLGNIVQVTGTMALFFTTVEIENITNVTLVSSGNPPLQPQILGTGAAASPSWEGTFIQSAGPITSIGTTGGSAPATNYTINDGTGPVVIRVVNDLGVPNFSVGQTITGRGAGGAFQSDFQIHIGRAVDVFTGGGGPDTTPPTISSAFAASATRLDVGWSEAVTTATANVTGNYTVFLTSNPLMTLPVSAAVTSGARTTTSLTLGSPMANGSNYTVRISNVRDDAGNTIVPNSTRAFTYSASTATPIADIQNNPSAFDGQVVTVRGQVFVPSNYISSRFSGYIQDESNRGINVFGNGANNQALFNTTNIVQVTGTVTLFFTTVEIENITNVTLLSSGNDELSPRVLGTGAAANAAWEGTYIQSSGIVQVIGTTGGSAPATNYTINDGTGPVVLRVVDDINAPTFSVGQRVLGRGAGGAFQSDFQIHIGRASDIQEDTGGGGGEASGTFSLSGEPYTFLPRYGETYPLTFQIPQDVLLGGETILRIYDMTGRLRRTLIDSRYQQSISSPAEWDGRDENRELVPAGTYIAHLSIVNSRTGARDQRQIAVVVATRMSR